MGGELVEEALEVDDGIFALAHVPKGARSVAVLAHGIVWIMRRIEPRRCPGISPYASWALVDLNLAVVRFDFRGHGRSRAVEEGVSVDSEVADLRSVLRAIERRIKLPVVKFRGSSFGACATTIVAANDHLGAIGELRFLNPVIDPWGVFVKPGTPWSRRILKQAVVEAALTADKRVRFEGGVEVGRAFFASLSEWPIEELMRRIPAVILVVQGTAGMTTLTNDLPGGRWRTITPHRS